MDVFNGYSVGGGANVDLSNLSPSGRQAILNIASGGSGQVGTVTSVNNVAPVAGNVSLNTDSIPQGVNKYYTDNAVDTHLLATLISDQDILYRNGTSLARFPVGATNTYLTTDINSKLSWATKPNVYNKLSTLDDCSIAATSNNQFLVYENLFWKNKSITTDNITQGVANLYYNDSLVLSYLKSIMTNTGDLIYRDSNNNIVRLAIGTSGQHLVVSVSGIPTWTSTSLTTLNNSVTDVEYNQTLTDNMYMYYDNAVGVKKWRVDNLQLNNGRFGDINMSAYSAGDVLILNGVSGKWENKAPIWINKTEYTASGDLLYGTGNGTYTKLSIGANDKVLQVKSGALSWETLPAGVTSLSSLTDVSLGTLADNDYLYYDNSVGVQKWKNKQPTWINKTEYTASGDILYGTGNGTYTKLSIGANDKVLQVKSGVPSWETFSAATTLSALTDVSLGTLSDGQMLTYDDAVGVKKWVNKTYTVPKFDKLGNTASDCNFQTTINTHDQIYYENSKWQTGLINLFWLANTSQANGLNNNDVLTYNSTSTKWENIPFSTTSTSFLKGILTTSQDLLYRNSSNNLARLGIGSNGQSIMARAGGLVWDRPVFNDGDIGGVSITTPVNGNVLQYNGLNWTNTTTLSTAVTNIATLNTTVTTLANNQYIVNVNPAPNPTRTQTYDQVNHPVNVSTYNGLSNVTPQNNLGVVQWAPTTVLAYPNAYYYTNATEVGGNYTGDMSNKLSQYFNSAFGSGFPKEAMFQTGIDNWTGGTYLRGSVFTINFHDNPVAVTGGSNLQFRNSTFTNGTNNLTNAVAVYGLIDATGTNLTSMFDGTFAYSNGFPPTNTGVWVQLLATTVVNTGGGGIIQNLACNNAASQIHAIAIYQLYLVNNRNTYCYWQQTTNITENSVIPTNITYSKASGSLVLTNVNAGRLNETWNLNVQNVMLYDYINQIVPVVRGTNSLYLSNTQYTDSNIRINNGTNNYAFQNSVGTQSFMTVSSTGIVVPSNRSAMGYFYNNNLSFQTTIAVNNTWYEIVPAALSMDIFGSASFVLNGTSRMICSVAGVYSINISYTGQLADGTELVVRASRDGNTANPTRFYNGGISVGMSNNEYQTYKISFIANIAVNDFLSIYVTKTGGGGNKIVSTLAYSITATNMMNS